MHPPGTFNVEEMYDRFRIKKHVKPVVPEAFMIFVNGVARFAGVDWNESVPGGFIEWIANYPEVGSEIVFFDPSTCDVVARFSGTRGLETWQ